MKILATLFLLLLSLLWYFIGYNYLSNLMPNTLLNSYNNYSILIFLAGMFVFGILFGKILSNKESKKILNNNSKLKNKKLSEELLESSNNRDYYEEIFTAKEEKENLIKTHSNYENDYEETKKSIDIILDQKKKNSKHNLNLKEQTLKNNFSEKKDNFILKNNELKNTFKIETDKIIEQKDKKSEDTMFLNVANNLKKQKKQDLKIIEGIGPKIEELLNKSGIYSYKDLANSNITEIKNILQKAGKRYLMLHNPITWSKQAKIADNGNFGELKKYQDRLVKGVEVK